MIYSNPEFVALLVLTVIAYALARSQRSRFGVLLVSSTVFYAWAGWVDLLIFELVMLASWSTVFLATVFPRHRKAFTTAGITVIVLHLMTWKYLSWLTSQVQGVFSSLWPGFLGGAHLRLAVPLGISFYTLQKIAYLVDVYRGVAEPVKLREYLLFNGFFAQLVAGPITRASTLIPQLRALSPIRAADLWEGTSLFVAGFFKKVAIADNLGVFVDHVFAQPHLYGRGELTLAVVAFTSQIWADFSGYTDMGRGAARIFGIELPENFLSPFLSRGPSEFWRRWHITLGEWIRDYLFIPLWVKHQSWLGGGLVVVVTMFLAGLWHGAAWTFALYGLYWGALLVLEHYWRRTAIFKSGFRSLPSGLQWLSSVSLTFSLTVFSRLLFRAGNFGELRRFLDAFVSHPGPYASYHLSFVGSLILVSFLFQILTYRKLEPGSRPLWRRVYDRWLGRWIREREWSTLAIGAAGALFGVALSVAFVGSVSLSLRPKATRPFIYWSVPGDSAP